MEKRWATTQGHPNGGVARDGGSDLLNFYKFNGKSLAALQVLGFHNKPKASCIYKFHFAISRVTVKWVLFRLLCRHFKISLRCLSKIEIKLFSNWGKNARSFTAKSNVNKHLVTPLLNDTWLVFGNSVGQSVTNAITSLLALALGFIAKIFVPEERSMKVGFISAL